MRADGRGGRSTTDPSIVVDGRFVAIQDSQKQTLAEHRVHWDRLVEQLLVVGGNYLVMPLWWDEAVPMLTRVGREFTIGELELELGQRSRCHVNVSRMHLANPKVGIATGYALGGGDDKWRQHSWAIASDGHIFETTSIRDAYFGMVLPPEIVTRWAKAQVGAA